MSYWETRLLNNQNKISDKNIKEINKQISKYYGKAMENVIGEFEATYDKLLITVGEGRTPTPADLYKLEKYWKLQAQLREELTALGNKELVIMSKQFETNFFEVYYSLNLASGEVFSTISTEGARQLINSIWVEDGLSWSQRVWNNVELLQQELNDNLLDCVITGKKTSQLKDLLQERFDVSYSRADALVRTEMAHIQTEASRQRYLDAGITEVEVFADKDERQCEYCGKLHKKRFPINGVMPIPAHPNCRCNILPVINN